MCVWVSVCVFEQLERERGREGVYVCVGVCVLIMCVFEQLERGKRERGSVCVCGCLCVCSSS